MGATHDVAVGSPVGPTRDIVTEMARAAPMSRNSHDAKVASYFTVICPDSPKVGITRLRCCHPSNTSHPSNTALAITNDP